MIAALGVSTVIDGSVQRWGNRVRVRVQLIDAGSDTYVDSLSVDRPLADPVSFEGSVAQELAAGLRRQMGREARLRAAPLGTDNRAASELARRAQAAREDAREIAESPHQEDRSTALEALGRDSARAAVARGLESVRWPGRLEVLSEQPLVIADGAHNADSGRRLREALGEYFGAGRVLFIVGASSDKDIDGLAEALGPIAERVIAARTSHPRAMEPVRIVEAFRKFGVPGEDVESVTIAMQRALAASGEHRLICLSGSLFVAAEGREYFDKKA